VKKATEYVGGDEVFNQEQRSGMMMTLKNKDDKKEIR
jgi:hypothetical protein